MNTYVEARNKRLEDNNKRFQDLGILKIAKSLSNLKTPEKKSVQRCRKLKSESIYTKEPRRSCRERNPVASYRDDVLDDLVIARPHMRKRSKLSSSWASYIARPLDEIKTASYEERNKAIECADSLQSKLSSSSSSTKDPSFVKSMVRSHVYSCFWLGLPSRFCETYLPKDTVDIVLEDEKGEEYNAVYIGKRAGLSGGWRGFALEHKLDDGDALVFQLVQPRRFKVYIVRASDCWNGDEPTEAKTKEEEEELVKGTRRTSTRKKNN